MVCASIGRDLGLGFLYIVTRVMGCFFGCFRGRDNHRSRSRFVSDPIPPKAREAVIPGNGLASLFLSQDEDSPCKGKETHAWGSLQPGTNEIGLKEEAKFLKACGTLPETPAEIRKASNNLECSPTHGGDSDPSKFHSWFPNTSIKKLQLSDQAEYLPTPVKLREHLGMASSSSEDTPSSCVSDGKNMGRIAASSCKGSGLKDNFAMKVHANQADKISISLATPSSSAVNLQSRSKFVRFDCDPSTPSVSSSSSSSEVVREQIISEHSKKTIPLDSHSVSKPSPYPTPLKLNDEMETPGTVFPANMDNLATGKNARIRSQYVYSVLNPVENFSQWKVLKEDDSDPIQLSGQERESLEQPEKAISKFGVGERENCETEELKVEASLSAWLKPSRSSQGEKKQYFGATSNIKPPLGRTPSDRPILGTVATHWNEDELPQVSPPKWWDGNGIPNSTNKYKEDQKVSWHATPFEERLEKALSEENSAPQRRDSGTPLAFDENEECDTAISQMNSSGHPKPVVSF